MANQTCESKLSKSEAKVLAPRFYACIVGDNMTWFKICLLLYSLLLCFFASLYFCSFDLFLLVSSSLFSASAFTFLCLLLVMQLLS